MKEFLAYTAARLALFAATYGLVVGLYILVVGTPVPVLMTLLVAAIISGVASVYLLRGMRERFTAKVQGRADRMSQRFEEMKAKEDVD
jgi:membrane protein implicated in regulation of membrane protease activity